MPNNSLQGFDRLKNFLNMNSSTLYDPSYKTIMGVDKTTWDSNPSLQGLITESYDNLGLGDKVSLSVDNLTGSNVGSTIQNNLSSALSNINPMDIFNYLQQKDIYELQKSAIDDQLKNSRMQRDLSYDQLQNKKNTQASLAAGFGADPSGYTSSLKKFEKYASK